jgi:fatty acid-binding protein DegV
VLHVSPVVGLQNGEVYPIERVRGRRRALERICQIVEAYGPLTHLAVGHTTDEAGMMALAEQLSGQFPTERMLFAQCGATLGTYLGPGAFGVALIQSGG